MLDTAELHWWLLGFGDGAEVVEPKELRDEFRAIAGEMSKLTMTVNVIVANHRRHRTSRAPALSVQER